MMKTIVKEVDIHRMRALDAKRYLERVIQKCELDVCELVVVHGFNSGTALREMIVNDLHHHRIKQKVPSLNPGRTRLILK